MARPPCVTNCDHITEVHWSLPLCHLHGIPLDQSTLWSSYFTFKWLWDALPVLILFEPQILSCLSKKVSQRPSSSWADSVLAMCLSFFTACCLQTLDTLTPVEGTREALSVCRLVTAPKASVTLTVCSLWSTAGKWETEWNMPSEWNWVIYT